MDRFRAKKEWNDEELDKDLEFPRSDDREPEPGDLEDLETRPDDDEPGGFESDNDDHGLDFPIGARVGD